MRRRILLGGVASCMLTTAALAAPIVEVSFVRPEAFTDVGPVSERGAILRDLRQLFESLAARYLKGDDQLSIEVIDVDLAGHVDLTRRSGRAIRVVRDGDPPRMVLRYSLIRGGLRSTGENLVVDPSFRTGTYDCRAAGTLCHESKLLDTWFSRLLGASTPPTAN